MTSISVNAKRVIDSSSSPTPPSATADIAAVQHLVEAVCRTYDMAFLKSTDESTFVSKGVDSAMNDGSRILVPTGDLLTGGFWVRPGGQVPDHVKADITAVYEAIRRCGLLDARTASWPSRWSRTDRREPEEEGSGPFQLSSER